VLTDAQKVKRLENMIKDVTLGQPDEAQRQLRNQFTEYRTEIGEIAPCGCPVTLFDYSASGESKRPVLMQSMTVSGTKIPGAIWCSKSYHGKN